MGKFGVIGFGNMGSAIVRGLVSEDNKSKSEIKLTKEDINIYDSAIETKRKAGDEGFNTYTSEIDLVNNSEMVLLAVKPDKALEVLEKIGSALENKLLISIVAGLDSKTVRDYCHERTGILRVMPNTPAIVGEGVFALDAGTNITDSEKEYVEKMFNSLGMPEWIDEKLFPVVTALSGGGPAFVAMFVEALADAGVLYGLKRDVAIRMAEKTVLGSAAQLLETKIHPAILKDMVCSPSGTTIEGVKALEDGGFRGTVIEAVKAATLKSKK